MRKIVMILAITLFFAGCSGAKTSEEGDKETAIGAENETTEDVATPSEGYSFEYNDVTIPMNVDAAPIVEVLGEPVEYFEAASCAFQGLDKIYYYNGFELGTYPNAEKDFVSYVNLLDDSVTTEKGIYLGSTLDDIIAAYGDDYTAEGTSYVYRLGETKLTFIVEEDAVTAITYFAIVEGLNN
ncbi:MAG: hypothetical protein K0R46_1263 [Herbinix sp.]|jgi:hypothetical protein|nr:hypothetical protein [Herbinix sp.]